MRAESNKTSIITEIRLVQSILKMKISEFKDLQKLNSNTLMDMLIDLRKEYKNKGGN
jgi:hypothetical protein